MPDSRVRAADSPATAQIRAEVWAGLNRAPKEISPKYFYDERGSALFDEITRLPEYYPTRTESRLLEEFTPAWLARVRPRTLVELGPGSADKARILLASMDRDAVYVPVDISPSYLALVVADIGIGFPEITVLPSQSDITVFSLPDSLETPIVYAFLGSTIGNFNETAAVQLLSRVRAAMGPEDRFLLGVDLLKDVATLERAYNDAQGVTAEFNLNVLNVLNRRLGTDFDLAAFRHRAFFNDRERRIEMHLVSTVLQRIHVPRRGSISLEQGETIRTEISCKYDRGAVAELFSRSGLALEHWTVDVRGWFALVVGRTA